MTDNQQQESKTVIEIVLFDTVLVAYRNSLTKENAVHFKVPKMGYWFTGKWGMEYLKGGLIDTGKHLF